MSKTITYRAITVAIGILVAAVIAFTLWVRTPRQDSTTGFRSEHPSVLHAAKSLLKSVTAIREYRP